jgi:hypothetical protein
MFFVWFEKQIQTAKGPIAVCIERGERSHASNPLQKPI